jgi:hypothetical protein
LCILSRLGVWVHLAFHMPAHTGDYGDLETIVYSVDFGARG